MYLSKFRKYRSFSRLCECVTDFGEKNAPSPLKTIAENFPTLDFEDLGYNCAVVGQKSYNGVAMIVVPRGVWPCVANSFPERSVTMTCAGIILLEI